MRVALVSGHFMPEIGYQECALAKELAASTQVDEVRVFTTTSVSPNGRAVVGKDYPEGLTRSAIGYEVLRLTPLFSVGSITYSRHLSDAIDDFSPDVILVVAVAKLFPWPVFTRRFARCRVIVLFGDSVEYRQNAGGRSGVTSALKGLLRKLQKTAYTRAFQFADTLVFNHPEVQEAIEAEYGNSVLEGHESKIRKLTLGFDSDEFHFSPEDRTTCRQSHDIPDDRLVLITVTRVTSKKDLPQLISMIDELSASLVQEVTYLLVGFMEQDSYSDEVRAFSRDMQHCQVLCLPFADADRVNQLFNAADLGIWPTAAITIQQALGTGLPVVLSASRNIAHLKDSGKVFSQSDGTLLDSVGDAVEWLRDEESPEQRRGRADLARQHLSYPNVIRRILE